MLSCIISTRKERGQPRRGSLSRTSQPLARAQDAHQPPDIVLEAGGGAQYAWDEFFSGIESPNTLRAYRKAVTRLLLWCDAQGLELKTIRPGRTGLRRRPQGRCPTSRARARATAGAE